MMLEQRWLGGKCHDCGAEEGELHSQGCDMEICFRCGRQAITCYEHCVHPEDGRPREEFVNGDRYPYIITPVFCRRCLEPYPELFHAGDWDVVVPPDLRGDVLCRGCYEFVRAAWVRANP